MRTVASFGPFRTTVREVPGPDRIAVCVRVDRVNEDGEWITHALYDVRDLWWLLPALQAAQAEAARVKNTGTLHASTQTMKGNDA